MSFSINLLFTLIDVLNVFNFDTFNKNDRFLFSISFLKLMLLIWLLNRSWYYSIELRQKRR